MAKTTVGLATTYVTTRASKHGALLCAAEKVGKSVTGVTLAVRCTGEPYAYYMVTVVIANRHLNSHASRCAQATHEHRQQMTDPSPNYNLPSTLCRTRQQYARHRSRSGPGICLSGGRRKRFVSRRLIAWLQAC